MKKNETKQIKHKTQTKVDNTSKHQQQINTYINKTKKHNQTSRTIKQIKTYLNTFKKLLSIHKHQKHKTKSNKSTHNTSQNKT